ncbi:MAG: hypothetical protein ACYC3O_00475 [Burkholderiales bacterium]
MHYTDPSVSIAYQVFLLFRPDFRHFTQTAQLFLSLDMQDKTAFNPFKPFLPAMINPWVHDVFRLQDMGTSRSNQLFSQSIVYQITKLQQNLKGNTSRVYEILCFARLK